MNNSTQTHTSNWNSDLSVWLSVDPLSDKYPSMSAFMYCAGNPMKFIDPDGREFRNPTWSNVKPVIEKEKFVKYDGNQCFDLAIKQLEVAGFTPKAGYFGKDIHTGKSTTFQTYTEKNGVNKNETENAIKYINKSLEDGKPVLAGIDNAPGNPGNHDKTTDHYIVIVGKGNDLKGNYYIFFDNATSNVDEGTSPNNKLYYNSETGKLTGQSQNAYARRRERDYTVTHVRQTKKIEGE